LRYAALSDTGKVRTQNEDTWNIILNKEKLPIGFVVADGMGGHRAGDIASRIAVEVMSETIVSLAELSMNLEDAEIFLRDGVDEANRRIIQYSADFLQGVPSGTTLTAAFLDGPMMILIHIGDSRAYLFRNRNARLLSKDHTYVADLVAKGALNTDAAKVHPERNKVTRALGFDFTMKPDVFWERIHGNDLLLFCTDGLTEYVCEPEMMNILRRFDPETAVKELVALANNRGGKDNVTVIVVQIDKTDIEK